MGLTHYEMVEMATRRGKNSLLEQAVTFRQSRDALTLYVNIWVEWEGPACSRFCTVRFNMSDYDWSIHRDSPYSKGAVYTRKSIYHPWVLKETRYDNFEWPKEIWF